MLLLIRITSLRIRLIRRRGGLIFVSIFLLLAALAGPVGGGLIQTAQAQPVSLNRHKPSRSVHAETKKTKPSKSVVNTPRVRSSLRYSLWAEVEGKIRIFDSREEFKRFLDFIDKNRFDDIFVQVYRGGRSWFPMTAGDQTPYLNARSYGLDPLGELIAHAHARGIKVHAWINALRVESRTADLVKRLGNDVVLTDRQGRSLLDYTDDGIAPDRRFRLDTQGFWLDSSSPKIRDNLKRVVKDLIAAYPAIDGIHLDMIRYPFGQSLGKAPLREFGVGYSRDAIRRYYQERGPGYEKYRSGIIPSGPAWDEWRRLQLTILVSELKEVLLQIAPDKELSAAVIAAPNRGHDYALQDWGKWLANGLVDTAVPMSYSANPKIARENTQFDLAQRGRGKVILGLGAWLMLTQPNQLLYQTKMATELGADGVCLFSYANLQSPGGMLNAQATGALIDGCRTGKCPDLTSVTRRFGLGPGN